jgi:hypothetical protein
VTTLANRTVEPSEPSYPRSWRFDEDGDTVSGTFVRFDVAPTRDYGEKLILVLSAEGEEIGVWLLQTALESSIKDELARRSGHKLEPGERIVIRRLAEKQTEDGKRSYRPFRTYFADRPEVDAADFLGLGKPEAKGDVGLDGDIPF